MENFNRSFKKITFLSKHSFRKKTFFGLLKLQIAKIHIPINFSISIILWHPSHSRAWTWSKLIIIRSVLFCSSWNNSLVSFSCRENFSSFFGEQIALVVGFHLYQVMIKSMHNGYAASENWFDSSWWVPRSPFITKESPLNLTKNNFFFCKGELLKFFETNVFFFFLIHRKIWQKFPFMKGEGFRNFPRWWAFFFSQV